MSDLQKKFLGILVLSIFAVASFARAATVDPEIAAGQALASELQAGQIKCGSLAETDFKNLGDYFMEQMMGGAHAAMEQTIVSRSGEAGLDQMHIAMGERFSGCNPNATIPGGMMGYSGMPMMSTYGYNGTMMGYGYGYGPMGGYGYMGAWGWILMVLIWALIVGGVIALVRWFSGARGHHREKSAMEILKERYVKGEIDRKEFEEKKKDLNQ